MLLCVRLLDVAPDGGCRVSPALVAGVTRQRRDSSLWPCSSPSSSLARTTYSGWALPSIPLYGARTFLSPLVLNETGSDGLAGFGRRFYHAALTRLRATKRA